MRWVATDPRLASAACIALAIGVLGNSYLIFGIASAAAFSKLALLWPATAASGLIAISVLAWGETAGLSRGSRILAGAVVALLLAVPLGLDCLPPIARDELTHHLALPAVYVRAGRIVEIPFADQSYYPMLLDMLYTPLLAWLPDNTPKFLHLLFGVSAAAVVGLGASRAAGAAAGVLASTLILATPTVALLAGSAYVDLGLLFYSAVALVTLLRWFQTEESGWFAVSALSAGLCYTAKFNGLVVIALLTLGTVFFPKRRHSLRVVGAAAAYALLALVPMLPWLAKNALQTGNPMFPFFGGLFGHESRVTEGAASINVFQWRLWLYGESWLEIAAVPLRVFLTGRDGVPARFDGVLHPLFLIGIGAACWRGARREHRLLLGFAAAYFFIAFFRTTMRSRYVLPILPALALITAPVLADLLRRHRKIALAGLAGGAAFTLVHLGLKWQETDPLAYLSGREDRGTYVARFVPELPVLEYANGHLPPGSRVYLAFLGTRSYYCERPFTYDFYYSGVMLRRRIEASDDMLQILAGLRREGITHMIAADHLLARYMANSLSPDALDRWTSFAETHLSRVRSQNGVSLYQIG